MNALPDVPSVDPDEAHRRVVSGAVLLDVREADEWQAGRAPQATWIPMGDLTARRSELPEGRAIVVVCRSGARSARVTQALLGAGYDAANLAGGMRAWARAGFPVVAAGDTPGTVA